MKSILTIVFSILSWFSYAQIDLEEGLVAYYPFNNFAEDESQFGNDASTINEVQFVADEINGVSETVASFNGIDSYIEIPHADQINFDNEDAFSISLWINVPDDQLDLDGSINDILNKWSNSSSEPYPFLLRLFNSTDNNRSGVFNGAVYQSEMLNCVSPYVINLHSETRINDNNWHHIVFTRTSEKRLQLYVDCELEIDVEDYTNCTTENNSNIVLGMREANGFFSRAFNGKLDELRIYNRELTDDEINVLCGFVSSTSVENNTTEIKVFPNPVYRGTTIAFDLPFDKPLKHFQLINSLGASLGIYQPQDMITAPAGSYLILISLFDGQTLLKRLIVID